MWPMGHLDQGKVQFQISFRNFWDDPRQLQKKKFLVYFSPNPLAMVTLAARIYNMVARFLCIPGASETEDKYI